MSISTKKHTLALKLFLSLYLLTQLFTLMHWPYVKIIAISSAAIIMVFYPLRYAAKPNKIMLDHVKMAWFIAYAVQIFFQLQNHYPLEVFKTILFIYWFLNEGFFYFKFNLKFFGGKEKELNILDDFEEQKPNNYKAKIVDAILILGAILVLVSALFQIMHWPFAMETRLVAFPTLIVALWFKEF